MQPTLLTDSGVGWANNFSFTICTVIIDMQPTLLTRLAYQACVTMAGKDSRR
ncbi:MAG: hypothetical protein F6J90_16745 [Moorea sp. SIOASIH]|nr:hypothetical protein [Moorena sp. SIOASIH]